MSANTPKGDRTAMDKRASSVLLQDIFDQVHKLIPGVEREPHGFSFRGRLGTTHLIVRPVSHTAKDGPRITDVVTIKTDITDFPIPEGGAVATLSALNMNSALSALMQLRRGESTVLVSRLSAFEGDYEAWTLYTPMLCFAAAFQSEFFCKTILCALPSEDHQGDTEVLPEGNAASPWDVHDFGAAQGLLDRIGVLASSGATGLTAEFPWNTGAISQMERFIKGRPAGGRTSLLTLTTTERHPALGGGLLCRLTLPVSYPEEQLARAACRLNVLEAAAIDTPPFLGAWTVDPETSSLAFVTFWPNVLCRPGVAANLTIWMMARSKTARRWTQVERPCPR
jgi:hypothetical protein